MKLMAIWIAALLAVAGAAACSAPGTQSEGAAKLAQDFARAGIVPGEPLPTNLQLTNDEFMQMAFPEGTGYSCGNAGFAVDSQGNLKLCFLSDASDYPGGQQLSAVNVATETGASLFSLSDEEAIRLYGEPSERYIEDTNPPPVLYYNYSYRKGRNTYIVIGLAFPQGGGKMNGATVMALTEDEARESEMLDGKHKLFAWPKGL